MASLVCKQWILGRGSHTLCGAIHALISRIGESFQKTFQQHVRDLEVHECLTFGRCLQENFKEKSSTRMMTLDSVRSSEFYQKFIEFCDPCIGVVVIFVQKTLKFIGFGSCSPTAHIFASTCYIYRLLPTFLLGTGDP